MYNISFSKKKKVAMVIDKNGWCTYEKDYYSDSEEMEKIVCTGKCTYPLSEGMKVNLVNVSGYIRVDVDGSDVLIEVKNNLCIRCPLDRQNGYLPCELKHSFDIHEEKYYYLTIGKPDTERGKGTAVYLNILFMVVNGNIELMQNHYRTTIGTISSDVTEMNLNFDVGGTLPEDQLVLVKKSELFL